MRKALELDATGADMFVIANADTVMQRSSIFDGRGLSERADQQELDEHETLLSIAKAGRVLGYPPQHSWRDQ